MAVRPFPRPELALESSAAFRGYEGGGVLATLAPGLGAAVVAVRAPQGVGGEEVAARLSEIGFVAGERVRVLARAPLGDAIAVRVGSSTFALRLAEAACVLVEPVGEVT